MYWCSSAVRRVWTLENKEVECLYPIGKSNRLSQCNHRFRSFYNHWTASDYGSNETVSGESIMQYQNAKKNTVNLNKWTKVVNTNCRVNCSLDSSGDWNFILPGDTWINTSKFDSSFYSGYQLFIQNFGTQSLGTTFQPSFTINTELIVEFMQPAFQTSPSSFTIQIFDLLMTVQPDPADLTITRNYIFQSYNVGLVGGVRQITIRLKRRWCSWFFDLHWSTITGSHNIWN